MPFAVDHAIINNISPSQEYVIRVCPISFFRKPSCHSQQSIQNHKEAELPSFLALQSYLTSSLTQLELQ